MYDNYENIWEVCEHIVFVVSAWHSYVTSINTAGTSANTSSSPHGIRMEHKYEKHARGLRIYHVCQLSLPLPCNTTIKFSGVCANTSQVSHRCLATPPPPPKVIILYGHIVALVVAVALSTPPPPQIVF